MITRNKYVRLYFEHHSSNVSSAIEDSCNDAFPLCSPCTYPASERRQDMPADKAVRYTVNAVNSRVNYVYPDAAEFFIVKITFSLP